LWQLTLALVEMVRKTGSEEAGFADVAELLCRGRCMWKITKDIPYGTDRPKGRVGNGIIHSQGQRVRINNNMKFTQNVPVPLPA
jgi:hypothetical protein